MEVVVEDGGGRRGGAWIVQIYVREKVEGYFGIFGAFNDKCFEELL